MKKYIAITVFALAIALLSVFARNLGVTEDVPDTENNISDIGITSVETIN